MRFPSAAVATGFATLLIAGPAAAANSVSLIWSGTTGSGLTGADTIEIDRGDTLTLDIVLNIDTEGVSSFSIGLTFDSIELVMIGFTECAGYVIPGSCVTSTFQVLTPFVPGVTFDNVGFPSTAFAWDGVDGAMPFESIPQSLVVGTAVFRIPRCCRNPFVSTLYRPGLDGIVDASANVSLPAALAVAVPEAGTTALMALAVAALVAVRRYREPVPGPGSGGARRIPLAGCSPLPGRPILPLAAGWVSVGERAPIPALRRGRRRSRRRDVMSTFVCMGARLRAIALAALLAAAGAQAQEGQGQQQALEPLDWRQGPITAPIGEDLAEIELPAGYLVLDGPNTQRLMEYMQNPVSGSEVATVASASENAEWFVVFEWSDIGYVEDEEGADLDADAILESIREGTAAANEHRQERGWPTLEVVGWHEEPHYDYDTNNLTWAIVGESEGQQSINRIIKLLGRRGVMTATLVSPPDALASSAAETDMLLAAYSFKPGSTYAEYVPGKDRLAEIGLTALVVGGAGAALVKSGLLARFWKLILGGLVAVGAVVKRIFGSSRAEESPTSQA